MQKLILLCAVTLLAACGSDSDSNDGDLNTGNLSVRYDADPLGFCIQIDNLSGSFASELTSESEGLYEYGICPDQYSYKCDWDKEGLAGTTYFTSDYGFSNAAMYCSNNEIQGSFSTL